MSLYTLWSGIGGAAPVLAQIPGALRDGFQAGLGIMFLSGFIWGVIKIWSGADKMSKGDADGKMGIVAGIIIAAAAATYRRYAVLDATQANTEQVADETKDRERELQAEIAVTLGELRDAPTESETQKLSAKLTALNGQLAQVEAARRREVDAVALQKIANDARLEQERLAAAELASKDDYLANQRVSSYLNTLRVRKNPPREN